MTKLGIICPPFFTKICRQSLRFIEASEMIREKKLQLMRYTTPLNAIDVIYQLHGYAV